MTIVLAGALAGCAASDPPVEHDSTAADLLIQKAIEADSSCVVVSQEGEALVEYSDGTDEPVRAFSVTKSVTALLVGIAQDTGHLSIDDPVSRFVPEWVGTPSHDVTIRDVLTNTSGREWDSRTDYRDMALKAPDKTSLAISLGQEAEPGTTWIYNNSAVQVLEAVLETAIGTPVDDFAETVLFQPLGMVDSRLEQDDAGNANVFAGLWTTCGDLIRLGQLVLDGGAAPSGEQIVSRQFLEEATAAPSTELNAAYGYLWWLNHPGDAVTPEVAITGEGGSIDGPIVPRAPEDALWALGFNNQILAVLPIDGAIAVRLGPKPPKDVDMSVRPFTESVLDAIAER
ncbi:serine hydrolase [Microbacterium sp.]|uniref:serine hydrolase domain-containing protein n=1 Tax=Microbacterium sp. TaxID=51671 RepID=UPI0027333043|nr:serine hydrolase domain-containing protein [Microbacterium sp.]MDP3950900.1 serine hydrolase domain-containing protein [Microbacterium sp.]